MIGVHEKASQIFFLNIGNSKEHIEKAINELQIRDVVIFSSIQLKDEVDEFLGHLKNKGMNVLETHYIDPFAENSLRNIISIMLSVTERHAAGAEFVAGLTGGTNIMAVAFGIVAMIKGLRCNYILKREEDFLLRIDTFKEIDRSVPLEEIGRFFAEGKQ